MPAYYSNVGGAFNGTHIYYNIDITNDNTSYKVNSDASGNIIQPPQLISTAKTDIPIVFNETRSAPYLENPSEYFLSVQRFSIENPVLPVFVAQPIVGQSDVNKTIYQITLGSGTLGYQSVNVTWVPQDLTVPKPATVPLTALSSPYYYCYSYQHFCDCINTALKSAATTLSIASAPYFQYDPVTSLFTIGGDASIYRTDEGGVPFSTNVNLYLNSELYNLFSSIPAVYLGGTIAGPGLNYRIIFSTGTDQATPATLSYITNVRTNTLASVNDVIVVQEYSTLPLWTPVKSIVLTTNLLPVVPELIARPVIFGTNENNTFYSGPRTAVYNSSGVITGYTSVSFSTQQNADVLNVLVDHVVPQITGTETKPYIYYEPTAEFRLTELYGINPLSAIQIGVFWKDAQGNLNTFPLGLGCTATIKLLFRKKTYNSTSI